MTHFTQQPLQTGSPFSDAGVLPGHSSDLNASFTRKSAAGFGLSRSFDSEQILRGKTAGDNPTRSFARVRAVLGGLVQSEQPIPFEKTTRDTLTGVKQTDRLVGANSRDVLTTQRQSNFQRSSVQRIAAQNFSTFDSDGTADTATGWGLNNSTWYAWNDSVGGQQNGTIDSQDYYRFSIGTTSTFNLVMSGLGADADVSLVDQNGSTLISSTNVGTHSIGGGAYSLSTSESFDRSLTAGTYYLKVNSYDGTATPYKLDFLLSPTAATADWYSQNLRDSGVRNWTRQLGNDGISRNEMINIMRSALDGGTIDSTEVGDLRTIVYNSGRFQMADFVKNLSSKVLLSATANTYQGNYIGQLSSSGESAITFDKRVGKWFLGNDLPSSYVPRSGNTPARTITYGKATTAGSSKEEMLFGTDRTISGSDVRQGYLGNCYFLASLSGMAHQRSSQIQNMFINNGDGTFTVRLYGQNNGTVTTGAEYVTVNSYLPTSVNPGGKFAAYDSSTTGLWVGLAEKAYAQFSEFGVTQRSSLANNYGSTEGGWGYRVMNSLTGITQGGYYSDVSYSNLGPRKGSFLSLSSIKNMLGQGWAITADTIGSPSSGIVGSHEYAITSVDSNNNLRLWNPHGSSITLSYNTFKANFNIINIG